MLTLVTPSHPIVGESSPAFENFGFTRTFGYDAAPAEVLRVLLFNRYDKDAEIFKPHCYTSICVRQKSEVEGAYYRYDCDRDRIRGLINLTATYTLDIVRPGDFEEGGRVFGSALAELYPDYKHLEAIEAYLSRESKRTAKVLFSEKYKHTVVTIDKWSVGITHLLVSVFPALMPWLVADKPLSDKERQLLSALTKENGLDEYSELLNEFYEKMDFRSQRISEQLKGFASAAVEQERRNLERQITDCDDNIAYLENQIGLHFKTRRDCMDKLNGVLQRIQEGGEESDAEIIEFFLANRRLNLLSVNGQQLDLEIETDLGNYDADCYEALRNNLRSYLYDDNLYGSVNPENARLLLDAIFQDQSCRIYMRSRFRLDFASHSFSNIQRSFSDAIRRRTVPNPHLHHFTCLGNNERNLRQALKNKDYVGAVAQLVTVTGNLNLHENVNGRYFLEDTFNFPDRICCIELPDKSRVCINDAIAWLLEHKEKTP